MIYYIGTCVDIDQYGDNYGFDPTEFAQAEDRAVSEDIDISPKVFFNQAKCPKDVKTILLSNKENWFAFDKELNVSWGYDIDTNIHYIFQGIV
jgi:hypothetical protein